MPDSGSAFDRFVARAAATPRRILFLETDGPSTLAALTRLADERIVVPCVPATTAGEGLPAGVVAVDPDADAIDGILTRGVPEGEAFHFVEPAAPTEAGETVLAFAAGAASPDVVRRTAQQYRKLCGTEPRVALLSFSTHGSARHRRVETVRRALEALRETDPDLAAGGELQGDAALVASVARAKAPGDPVAGRANVLIFPAGDSAEIGRALVEQLGGARIAGPFFFPAKRPVNPLSRDASAEAIVITAAVTALQAG